MRVSVVIGVIDAVGVLVAGAGVAVLVGVCVGRGVSVIVGVKVGSNSTVIA